MITQVNSDADALLARAAFERKRGPKSAMFSAEFNQLIREAESAIICIDTDAFDLRQRMEPLLDNERLNPAQQNRVMMMRAKLMKVLVEHGFIDVWGAAVKGSAAQEE